MQQDRHFVENINWKSDHREGSTCLSQDCLSNCTCLEASSQSGVHVIAQIDPAKRPWPRASAPVLNGALELQENRRKEDQSLHTYFPTSCLIVRRPELPLTPASSPSAQHLHPHRNRLCGSWPIRLKGPCPEKHRTDEITGKCLSELIKHLHILRSL